MPPRNPFVTVDIIIECNQGIVLIKRKNPPFGWALPGGFVDYGETLEAAAVREAEEETRLKITLIEQLHTYSDPNRDPRHHTVSTIFRAMTQGQPKAHDDAQKAAIFSSTHLPTPIVFDHATILDHYFQYMAGQPRQQVYGYSAQS